MNLYNLTLQSPQCVGHIATGCFSGNKVQEFVVSRGTGELELIRPDITNGKLSSITKTCIFGTIRSLEPFKLVGGSEKDYIVVGCDSGKLIILEYDDKNNLFSVVQETVFGRTGCRRVVSGQHIGVDPRGRALAVCAVERQKFIYIASRNGENGLILSSPLEFHCSNVVLEKIVGLDCGFENPLFACLEIYLRTEVSDEDTSNGKQGKFLTLYELDLGLNHVVKKYTESVSLECNHLIALPGGSGGPGGVLVCSDEHIVWKFMASTPIQIPLIQRKNSSHKYSVTGHSLHKTKNFFFVLVHTEIGDVLKIDFEYDGKKLTDMKIRYFDTILPSVAISVLKTGFLFACSESGTNSLYQIIKLADDSEYASKEYIPGKVLQFIPHEDLVNLLLVDETGGFGCIVDTDIVNITGEGVSQLYAVQSSFNNGYFSVLHRGLEISELALTELPEEPKDIWTLKNSLEDKHSSLVVVSFEEYTSVLSVGESIEEITDTLFVLESKTLLVAQMVNDSYIQVYPKGIRQIHKDNKVNEWKVPDKAFDISVCSCNDRELVVCIGDELRYFVVDEIGYLAETPHKLNYEVKVVGISLSPLIPGRGSFLAVSSKDSVVRIYDLGEQSTFSVLGIQVLECVATSLVISESRIDDIVCFYVHMGLENGVYAKMSLDRGSGELNPHTTRYIGSSPVRLFLMDMCDGHEAVYGVLIVSSQMWISYFYNKKGYFTQIFCNGFDLCCDFRSDAAQNGFIAVSGSSLRIFSIDKLGSVFSMRKMSLEMRPKRLVYEKKTGLFSVIAQVCIDGGWKSMIGMIDPLTLKFVDQIHIDNSKVSSMEICYVGEKTLIVTGMSILESGSDSKHGRKNEHFVLKVHTINISEKPTLEFLYENDVDEEVLCIRKFGGCVLVGMGGVLRLYDFGKKQLLRKCEIKSVFDKIVSIDVRNNRIVVADVHRSLCYVTFNHRLGRFHIVAKDTRPRWMTRLLRLDYDTTAGADKFGNFFVLRLDPEISEQIDSKNNNLRLVNDAYENSLKSIAEYYVGDTITSMHKLALVSGGKEVIVYVTIFGSVGVLIPFLTKSDVILFQQLELAVRNYIKPLSGWSHLSFRSYYNPVKNVVDGDFCEMFCLLDPNTKEKIAESVERSVRDIEDRLTLMRLSVSI